MTTLRILIVDDEPMARRRLVRMLDAIDGTEVVGEATDGASALDAMQRLDPDVVLLDIQMPGLDGLDVARRLGGRPTILFVTAHADFAVDAFEVAARDYLVKPVDPDRLGRAIERARNDLLSNAPPAPKSREATMANDATMVTARRGQTVYYFDAATLDAFRATNKYVGFVHEGRSYLTDESLVSLERRLAGLGFLRVHRNALVRVDAIRALTADGLGSAIALLADGSEVPVSRRRSRELRDRLAPAR